MSSYLMIAVVTDEKGFFHMFQTPHYKKPKPGQYLIADEGDGEEMYTVVSSAEFSMDYDEEQVKLLFAATNVNLPLRRATAVLDRREFEYGEYDYVFEEEKDGDLRTDPEGE